VRRAARAVGYDLVPGPAAVAAPARRLKMLDSTAIEVLLDVGANEGQYGRSLRSSGWNGRIVSFEPLHSAFEKLRAVADADAAWTVRELALGDVAGEAELNVSGTPMSSSLLPMLPAHEELVPESGYTHVERVRCERLDNVLDEFVAPSMSVGLKIDAQGFEMHVLTGASGVLARIALIEIEINLDQLYDGQPQAAALIRHLDDAGFRLVGVEPEHFSPATGQTSWLNAVFLRS
jgi:FkbM family methyltransferase